MEDHRRLLYGATYLSDRARAGPMPGVARTKPAHVKRQSRR